MSFLVLMTMHYIADYGVQTRWQGENKSHNLDALFSHITSYFLCLLVAALFILPWQVACLYASINALHHLTTDYFTSQWGAQAFKQGDLARFWQVHGLDQLLHISWLYLTYLIVST